jgi:hypothetical protein
MPREAVLDSNSGGIVLRLGGNWEGGWPGWERAEDGFKKAKSITGGPSEPHADR